MYRTRKPASLEGVVAGAMICLTLYCAGVTYDALRHHDKYAPIYGGFTAVNAVMAYCYLRKATKKEN